VQQLLPAGLGEDVIVVAAREQELLAIVVATGAVHPRPERGSLVGMRTDRIRTDITDIVFVFIFMFGFGLEYR
jgi:hypothetical protein